MAYTWDCEDYGSYKHPRLEEREEDVEFSFNSLSNETKPEPDYLKTISQGYLNVPRQENISVNENPGVLRCLGIGISIGIPISLAIYYSFQYFQ